MNTSEWSPRLIEWVYGPETDEDDEPLSVGEEYRISEEEERIRWIPGYRELVEHYLSELQKWHASWDRHGDYPPKPELVSRLEQRISEHQRIKAHRPPWELPSG